MATSSDPLPKRRKVEDDSWRLQTNLIRIVNRNDTLCNSAAARARANLLSAIEHPNDESLVRTAHDSLRDCDPVYKVEEPNGHCFWMVEVQDEPRLRHTYAQGYTPREGVFRNANQTSQESICAPD